MKDAAVVSRNQAVRDREKCLHCGDVVDDEDFGWKYAQAGGTLADPFYTRGCQLGWLME